MRTAVGPLGREVDDGKNRIRSTNLLWPAGKGGLGVHSIEKKKMRSSTEVVKQSLLGKKEKWVLNTRNGTTTQHKSCSRTKEGGGGSGLGKETAGQGIQQMLKDNDEEEFVFRTKNQKANTG